MGAAHASFGKTCDCPGVFLDCKYGYPAASNGMDWLIQSFVSLIPDEMRKVSGSVFYSGRSAFAGSKQLYVLGVNPGGSPVGREHETAEWHSKKVIESEPDNWSAYRDESWAGMPPGASGMQPRVLHMFDVLELDPGEVPCSNVVFVRSSQEATIDGHMAALGELCWPFHAQVIQSLSPRVIVCFGTTAGNFVRGKLGASDLLETYVEQNKRGWSSYLFGARDGQKVVVLTHPSRANWCNPTSDPTVLVKMALDY